MRCLAMCKPVAVLLNGLWLVCRSVHAFTNILQFFVTIVLLIIFEIVSILMKTLLTILRQVQNVRDRLLRRNGAQLAFV